MNCRIDIMIGACDHLSSQSQLLCWCLCAQQSMYVLAASYTNYILFLHFCEIMADYTYNLHRIEYSCYITVVYSKLPPTWNCIHFWKGHS